MIEGLTKQFDDFLQVLVGLCDIIQDKSLPSYFTLSIH